MNTLRTLSHSATPLVLAIDGVINYDQKSELSELLAHALASDAPLVVVDLSNATFLDGFGVGLLRTFNRWLRSEDRRLAIVAPQPYVQGVLSLAGLNSVMRVEASLEHALAGDVVLEEKTA